MRRRKLGHRLCIGLSGLLVAGGCTHYAARQDTTVLATSAGHPAVTTFWARNAVLGGGCRAEFDLPAVRAELAGTVAGRAPMAAPMSRTPPTPGATQANRGQGGVFVIQIPAVPDGSNVAGSRQGKGLMPAYLPEPNGGLPGTPPPPGPIVRLGFENVEHGSGDWPAKAATTGPACTSGVLLAEVPVETPPLGSRGETAPRRKSFVDLTASPCFGHAPDYAWLSGQVEHSRILGAWRLRYASVDESDRFGGSVTLVENSQAGYLRDGDYVRVEGHLVDPSSTDHSPAYNIEAFKIIDKPNEP